MFVAENLRKHAAARGLTQIDICRITGIPKPAMSNYFNGHNEPSIKRVKAIAEALDVPMSALVKDDIPSKNRKSPRLKNLPLREAAMLMGKTVQFVKEALQQGLFPWGFAVKIDDEWQYHISPKAFFEYLKTIS